MIEEKWETAFPAVTQNTVAQTWAEECAKLPPGLPYGARELIRRHTSPARHQWRTRQAASDALLAANTILAATHIPLSESDIASLANGNWRRGGAHLGPSTARVAAMLCRLEVKGTGGPLGITGGIDRGTQRSGWAQGLGKGRANASDGPAWTAAIQAAENLLMQGLLEAQRAGLTSADEVGENLQDCELLEFRDLELIDSPESRAEAARRMLAAYDCGEMGTVAKYGDLLVE